MTTLISAATPLAPARYSAEPADRVFDDGTAVLADVEGAEPMIGDLIVIRRPGTVRGRSVLGRPRTYRVESVEMHEASVLRHGTQIVRDMTTVHARFVPAVKP